MLSFLTIGLLIGAGVVTISQGEVTPIVDNHSAENLMIDQKQEQYDYDIPFFGDRWLAQSFRPTLPNLSKVELLIGRESVQDEDTYCLNVNGVFVSIRSDLRGPDLTQVFVPRNEIPEQVSWVEFDFPDIDIEFSSAKGYFILIRAIDIIESDFINRYILGCGIGNPYLNGSAWFSENEGRSWIEEPSLDFCFRTYGFISTSDYTLTSKYDFIKSYPGGGGIFSTYIEVHETFSGEVLLSIDAVDNLHAQLDKTVLTNDIKVAELTIQPDEEIDITTYTIEVIGELGSESQVISLEVEIIDVIYFEPSEYVIGKRDEFISWLYNEHPEYGDLSSQEWFSFVTYPGILVVEHWTFLSDEWEFRVCSHITIPPYNWSKMCLRQLGRVEASIAAHQEYDGTTYEIPIEEYPTFFGY